MNNFKTEELSLALGKRIKKIRERNGLTQDELAKKIGYSNRSYIANIERGSQNPSLNSINQIARTLDIPISRLFLNLEKDARGLNENIALIRNCWDKLINDRDFDFNFCNQLIIEECEETGELAKNEIITLSQEELEEKRQKSCGFLEAAQTYISFISTALGHKPHLLAITDEDGWLLELFRKGEFFTSYAVDGEEIDMEPGLNLSREYAGNNAPGYALASKKPVLLCGCDHNDFKYSHMISLGIPVYIRYSKFCGALSIHLYLEDFQFSDIFFMLMAVKNIEMLLESTNF